ncbi:MAG: hypothetical protein KAQ62_05050, partial [Cyclobacteriaceae bacterium]|nr:hypothetical protein [Cyclobacteriaceae bacterium]
MTKSRILLLLFVVVSTILLYMLPRYVVNNEEGEIKDEVTESSAKASLDLLSASDHDHSFHIPDSMAVIIAGFYESFKNAENQEKRIIFADSLA